MQLAFDEKGDVTIVRVQEAKLTYPVLAVALAANWLVQLFDRRLTGWAD